uniref:Uncharacterized protein n=1 Tax=Solanum lycopersicum TaxID=4081 RepID=A0A3Q7FZ07_SOLLC
MVTPSKSADHDVRLFLLRLGNMTTNEKVLRSSIVRTRSLSFSVVRLNKRIPIHAVLLCCIMICRGIDPEKFLADTIYWQDQGFIISETKNPSYPEYKMFFGTSNYII